MIIGLFSFICVLALVNTDAWQREFMGLVLLVVIVMSVGLAVFQGGIYGLGEVSA
ncbi:Uncharacterized protein FKW44_005549 [Caligus rogercresseyi]|uniref:Uncharacterized protein n=1 Tax=Caligus rogercresseyi TaxID=217165 RepID=A0A7T8QS43_CALRO|nr:Uncharacterized protein FKW44_005549 [Caligus rogercresseyi]